MTNFNIGDKVILIESRLNIDRDPAAGSIIEKLSNKILTIESIVDLGHRFLKFEGIKHSPTNSKLFDKNDVLSDRKSKIDNLNI